MAYNGNNSNPLPGDPSDLIDNLEPEVVEVGPGLPVVKPKGLPDPDGMNGLGK